MRLRKNINIPRIGNKIAFYGDKVNVKSCSVNHVGCLYETTPEANITLFLLNPNCIVGWGEIEPCDAKITQKCRCSHHNKTA